MTARTKARGRERAITEAYRRSRKWHRGKVGQVGTGDAYVAGFMSGIGYRASRKKPK